MTLSTTSNRVSYSGNGVTTAFSFPYLFFDEDDLTVILRASDGTETTQTITTNYTVTGEGVAAGGTVTMVTPPASGETLVILRDLDSVQETDITENGKIPSASLVQQFDKTIMLIQELEEILGRTIKLTPTSSSSNITISDPVANAVLKWNAGATAVEDGPTTTEIINAESNATAAAASASAASSSASAAAASAASAAATLASAFFNDVVFYDNTDSPVTLTQSDSGKLHSFDTSSGAITVNLPEISGLTLPLNYAFLLNTAGNDLTVNRGGSSDTIGSATSKVISQANTGFQLIPDTDTSPDRWSVLEFGSVGDNTVTKAKLVESATYLGTNSIDDGDSPYAVVDTDDLITVDAGSGAVEIDLPAVASYLGRELTIVLTDSTNLLTLDPNASETIDGNSALVLSSDYARVTLIATASGWITKEAQHFDYITQEITTATSTTTADTFVSTSQTITLPCAGTWLIGYQIAAYILESSGSLNNVFGRYELATSGDVAVNETIAIVGGGLTGSQLMYYAISKQAVVTVAASTTYKIRIKCNENGAQGGAAVLNASGTSGITDPDNRSFLWARRIK